MSFLKKIFQPKPQIDVRDVLNGIKYEGGTKFAANETNHIFVDIEELGGFPYLKTVIIGDTKLKVKRTGCKINFVLKNEVITLESDNTDIASNQIKNSPAHFTEIDFELKNDEAKKIKTGKIKEVQYEFKKEVFSFKTI